MKNLDIFPVPFWVVIALLAGCGIYAASKIRAGLGIPMLATLATVAFWYVGDAYYNDYAHYHVELFNKDILDRGWWQVAWFLVVFTVAAPWINQNVNRTRMRNGSGIARMISEGIAHPYFQRQLTLLQRGSFYLWLALVLWATIRTKGDLPHFLFPFLGYRAEPWGRGALGGGIDALLTVALYLQMLVTAIFGIVAALSTNRRVRTMAIVCCFLTWPYFLFDRTRNSQLAVIIPAVLCWAFLRLRGSFIKKAVALGAIFIAVNYWMKFVMASRDSGVSVVRAFQENGLSLQGEKVRHEGLNMYEELCWINTFIDNGELKVTWGKEYLDQLANPIPRVFWPNKPKAGYDYAVLRGQRTGGADQPITATISRGLIGQGVIGFGVFLGPMAAALIISFWAAILTRLDLEIFRLGRLPLFGTGLFAIFNVGRDFSFIALYPFLFGAVAFWFLERWQRRQRAGAPPRIGNRVRPFGGPASSHAPGPTGAYTQMRPAPARNRSRNWPSPATGRRPR